MVPVSSNFHLPSHCGLSPRPSLRSVPFWFLLPVSVFQCQGSTSSLAHFALYWNQVSYSNLRPVQFARLRSGSCKTGGRRCSLWWKINVTFYFGFVTTWDGSYLMIFDDPCYYCVEWLCMDFFWVSPYLHQCWYSDFKWPACRLLLQQFWSLLLITMNN